MSLNLHLKAKQTENNTEGQRQDNKRMKWNLITWATLQPIKVHQ